MAAELRLKSPPPLSGTRINVFPRLLTDGSGRLSLDFKNAAGTRLAYILIDDAGETLAKDLAALHASPLPGSTEKPVFDYTAGAQITPWSARQSSETGSEFGDPGKTTIRLIASPVFTGRKANEYTVSQTTASPVGPRAEDGDWNNKWAEGEEWWFGDVLYLPESNRALGWGFGHHTIMQLGHPGASAAAQELDIRDSGGYPLGIYLAGQTLVSGSSMYGRGIPIEIRIKASQSGNGEVEGWVDGKQVVLVKQATLAGLDGYFKQGQYGESRGNIVIWHGAKRGKIRASVQRSLATS
jgi:hypothetical protein